MRSLTQFSKYHGAGNDFILINNEDHYFSGQENRLFKHLCHRNFGIGADGILLVDQLKENQFHLRYFNSDGSEAGMCGNGSRCAVSFVSRMQPGFNHYLFTINAKIYRAELKSGDDIRVYWHSPPQIIPVEELSSIVPSEFSDFLVVDTGVPHLVLFVESSLNSVDLVHWGPFFRRHPLFLPAGINVNVVEVARNKVSIRTYERGVEKETLACGTGILASAVAAHYRKMADLPVRVAATGGQLQVGINPENNSFWLQGPVKFVYKGEFDPEEIISISSS
jgi:diaminopimelate epimerase